MAAGLVGGEGFAVDASVIEADASRFERVEGWQVDWSDAQRASRPVQEYLRALESENPTINPKQKPKAMSPSDPSAAWTTRGRHKVMFAYSLNYLIDMERLGHPRCRGDADADHKRSRRHRDHDRAHP